MKKMHSLLLASVVLTTGTITTLAADQTQTTTDMTNLVEVQIKEKTTNSQQEQAIDNALTQDSNSTQDREKYIEEEVQQQINDTQKKLERLLAKKFITKNEYNQFLKELDQVTNLDEWNKVNQLINDARTDSGFDNGTIREELDSEIEQTKIRLQKLLTSGKLTQEKYDNFIKELKDVQSLEDLNTVKQSITDATGIPDTDPGIMIDELNSEIQSTKDYLKELLDKGKITNANYDIFLKDLETITSLDDLNTVKQNIQKAIDEATNSTTQESNSTNSNSQPSTNKSISQKTLPKTGEEKNVNFATLLGASLLSSTLLIGLLKRRK